MSVRKYNQIKYVGTVVLKTFVPTLYYKYWIRKTYKTIPSHWCLMCVLYVHKMKRLSKNEHTIIQIKLKTTEDFIFVLNTMPICHICLYAQWY